MAANLDGVLQIGQLDGGGGLRGVGDSDGQLEVARDPHFVGTHAPLSAQLVGGVIHQSYLQRRLQNLHPVLTVLQHTSNNKLSTGTFSAFLKKSRPFVNRRVIYQCYSSRGRAVITLTIPRVLLAKPSINF